MASGEKKLSEFTFKDLESIQSDPNYDSSYGVGHNETDNINLKFKIKEIFDYVNLQMQSLTAQSRTISQQAPSGVPQDGEEWIVVEQPQT